MTSVCVDCGDEFYADEPWKVRCLDCWRDRKNRRDRGELKGYADGYAAGYAAGTCESQVLDVGFVRELVVLCHPDRHPPERFAQANAATAQLLTLLQTNAPRRAA